MCWGSVQALAQWPLGSTPAPSVTLIRNKQNKRRQMARYLHVGNKGAVSGSWSVMEAERCICFLSMAEDYFPYVAIYWSISPNKSRGKKQYMIEYTVVQSSHRISLFAPQIISWTADHSSLPPAKAHDSTCWISWGKKWQGQRTQTVWNTKRTWAFQRGLLWLSFQLPQPHNTEAGWAMDTTLAQWWWDQLKIWKEERFIDLLAANLSQIHSPFFFNFLPLFSVTLAKDWGWKIVWEWLRLQRMECWVCPLLTVSPAHRLFMWLCEEQPLPFSAAHPHPSISHSARSGWGGKSDLFCRGEFLGELVKASTVWAFISVERRRGRKERRSWMGSHGGEFGHSQPC